MAKINQNKLAKQISEHEGLKQQVNIAQIKEVLKVTLSILAFDYKNSEVLALIEDTVEAG